VTEYDRFWRGNPVEPQSGHWHVTRLTSTVPTWGSNGMMFGPDGRLYVAEFLRGVIDAVDVDSGTVETVVPNDGPLTGPDDVAFASDGAMYITDLPAGRVWCRSPSGELTVVGEGLRSPNGITCVGTRVFVNEMIVGGRLLELCPDGGEPRVLVDGIILGNAMQQGTDGKLYYPHLGAGQVWRVPLDGGEAELVADGFTHPVAVKFDRRGVLTVLHDGTNGLITSIDLTSGSRTTRTTGIPGLDNVTFDDANRMFVSSWGGAGIFEVRPDGTTRPVLRGGLNGPFGIAAGPDGQWFVADYFSLATVSAGQVERIGLVAAGFPAYSRGIALDGKALHVTTADGQVHTFDTVTRGVRLRAQGLSSLMGIATTGNGGVVFAEPDTGRVYVLDENDVPKVLADGLDSPCGVAFGDNGACYVTEQAGGRLTAIEDGRTRTIAAGLGSPQGLAVQGDRVFVVDIAGQRLVSVSLVDATVAVEATGLPVGPPPGTDPERPVEPPEEGPGRRRFADVAVTAGGEVVVGAEGEGTLLRLTPRN
jgi:sugar lactone lactonase YvrE